MSFQLAELEAEARRQHPEESDAEIARRVAYRAATLKRTPVLESSPRSWSIASAAWQAAKIAWAILILLLFAAIVVKAEPDERLRLIHRAMAAEASPAFDAPIIFLQDQTNQLAVIPAGKVIFNCSTNMACSWDSANRRFNMTASSTASTAFSALTASLNTNAGTFSASGNSWDFTAATIFKLRAGAGLTTSAAGDLGYDTTAGRWHGFIGAADRLFIGSTNVGVAGQAALSNADGTFTFADPIVSGPTAVGAAPTTNPVYVAGDDGTNIRALRLFDADSGAGIQYIQGVQLRKAAAGGSVELGTATDPVRTDPTGTTTQPVSLAAAIDVSDRAARVLGQVTGNVASGAADSGNPLKIGGVFNTTQPTVTTGQRVDAQFSARGELFIAKGVSGFSIDNTSFNVGTFPDNEPFNLAQIGGTATVTGGVAGSAGVGGVTADGAASTGNPVYVGGIASGNRQRLILCDLSAVISTATSGSTQLVALTAGQTIYVCSYNWMANGTVNVDLRYGTGAACATGPVTLTGAYNHTAQTGIAITSPSWSGIKTAASNALCVNLSAAIQVSGVVMYTKF